MDRLLKHAEKVAVLHQGCRLIAHHLNESRVQTLQDRITDICVSSSRTLLSRKENERVWAWGGDGSYIRPSLL